LIFYEPIIIFVVFVESTPGLGEATVKDKVRAVGTYAGLGIQLGVTIVAFCFAGYYLDGRLGTLPVLTIVGTFLGAGGAFYSIYRKLFPAEDKKKKG